uniref:Uncharacterized protein n=1 Tax=Arundo donax TaxID=35708 RepID=A0A0A9B0L7_ARUDO
MGQILLPSVKVVGMTNASCSIEIITIKIESFLESLFDSIGSTVIVWPVQLVPGLVIPTVECTLCMSFPCSVAS